MRSWKAKVSVAIAIVAGAGASMGAQALVGDEPAVAAGVCSPDIEQAIFNATGQNTGGNGNIGGGLACNPGLYNNGSWSSQGELQGYVNEVVGRCGPSDKLLVLAILESTGVPPQANVAGNDNVCHRPVYEAWVDHTSGVSNTINWNAYSGSSGSSTAYNIFGAVNGAMSECFQKQVSHAVISVTDHYPYTLMDSRPATLPSSSEGNNGQCNSRLYRSGAFTGYADLKQRVIDRAYAPACSNSQIDQAFDDISDWNPLPEECDASRYDYGNGTWTSQANLRSRAYHSLRCSQPEYGQVYAFDIGRTVRGAGWLVGECNYMVYTDGVFTSKADLRQKVAAANGVLVSQNVSFDNGGDVTVNGTEYDGNNVAIGSTTGAPSASTAGGRQFTVPSGNIRLVPKPGGAVISTGGGNVISTGGGNLISDKGLGLIGQAGGNVISTGGGN
jgi:hypothetical protein